MEPLFAKRINSRKTFPRQTIKTIYIWPLIFNSNSSKKILAIFHFVEKRFFAKMGELSKFWFSVGGQWMSSGRTSTQTQQTSPQQNLKKIFFLASNFFILNRIWKKSFSSCHNCSPQQNLKKNVCFASKLFCFTFNPGNSFLRCYVHLGWHFSKLIFYQYLFQQNILRNQSDIIQLTLYPRINCL